MKKIIYSTIAAAMILSFASCSYEPVKIEDTKSISDKITFAEKIVTDFFKANKNNTVVILGSEATKDMKKAFAPERQRKIFSEVVKFYGKFKSVTFVEAYRIKGLEETVIRFKGNFSNFSQKQLELEIRITINYKQKFSSFALKPWKDKMENQ